MVRSNPIGNTYMKCSIQKYRTTINVIGSNKVADIFLILDRSIGNCFLYVVCRPTLLHGRLPLGLCNTYRMTVQSILVTNDMKTSSKSFVLYFLKTIYVFLFLFLNVRAPMSCRPLKNANVCRFRFKYKHRVETLYAML